MNSDVNSDVFASGDEQPFEPSFEQLERTIRAAGDYVMPSDFLRARILEAARIREGQRRSLLRVVLLAAVVLVGCAFSLAMGEHLDTWRRAVCLPNASEMQVRALELASNPSIGQHWGLYEAFQQVRHLQAMHVPIAR